MGIQIILFSFPTVVTAILDAAIVERGRNIVTCSRDGTARLWDVGQQTELYAWTELGGEINCCTLAATDNSVQLGVPEQSPSKSLFVCDV